MPRYNTQFELDPNDMDLIETALRHAANDDATPNVDAEAAHNLLGRLHDQKVFFRPKSGVYVSG